MSEELKITQYGFKWGAAEIIRCASAPKWGVMFDVESNSHVLQIRVTPSGLIRVGVPVRKASK